MIARCVSETATELSTKQNNLIVSLAIFVIVLVIGIYIITKYINSDDDSTYVYSKAANEKYDLYSLPKTKIRLYKILHRSRR